MLEGPKLFEAGAPMKVSCPQAGTGAGVSAAQVGAEVLEGEEEEAANGDGSSEVSSSGDGVGVLGGGDVGE